MHVMHYTCVSYGGIISQNHLEKSVQHTIVFSDCCVVSPETAVPVVCLHHRDYQPAKW